MNNSGRLKVSIIIPTHERCESVKRALRALSNQTFPNDAYEVIISIDGSKDCTSEMVNNFKSQFALISIWKPNSGRASARNTGIRIAKGDILIFIDDDMEPSPDFIEAHYSYHKTGSKNFVIGAAPIFCDENSTLLEKYMARGFNSFLDNCLANPNYKIRLDDIYGGNFSIRRDLLLEAGEFDESFKLYGYEDTELAYRLIKKGIKVIYSSKAVCINHHDENFPGLAKKAVNAGMMAILLVHLHPETFEELCLCEYNSAGTKWRALRYLLIRLSLIFPFISHAIIAFVLFAEKFNLNFREKLYSLTLDYFMWLGILTAVMSDESNSELLSKIKSYQK